MTVCGIVVIGRNEGERLRVCLRSVCGSDRPVVYVDSGSSDESVAFARSVGARVVELELDVPFTAARARNRGVAELLRSRPDLEYVQFVDGDCEVVDGWLDLAELSLAREAALGVVCGRRRERFPDASVYNRLCDIEWDTPVGDAKACGGDAMFRVAAFVAVGGFDASLIAGEEPELCVRLRRAGWKIRRLDAEMTLHDAGITRFAQWWRRAKRGGHAFAEGACLHGLAPERHWVRESRSGLMWGLVLPVAAVAAAPATHGWSMAVLGAGYLRVAARTRKRLMERGFSSGDATLYGASCVIAKFPEAHGHLLYRWGRLRNRKRTLIEYKA